MARRALGYRSLEAPGNRRPRQMVTVPQGTQNPAYSPSSVHLLYPYSRKLQAADCGFWLRGKQECGIW